MLAWLPGCLHAIWVVTSLEDDVSSQPPAIGYQYFPQQPQQPPPSYYHVEYPPLSGSPSAPPEEDVSKAYPPPTALV